jgi:hypothetical protein
MLGFIHWQFAINLLQLPTPSIEALLFPKKLVFRGCKKVLAKTYLLTSFGLCGFSIG